MEDARARNNYALRKAAKNGHLDCLRYLREGYGLTVEDARTDGYDALHMAERDGYLPCL